MEEQKKKRPGAEIQQEYARLCSQAGHLQYEIAIKSKDLQVLNDTLRDLNLEYAAAQRAEAEAAKSSDNSEKPSS